MSLSRTSLGPAIEPRMVCVHRGVDHDVPPT
jgi:hypothetical protein